MLKTTWTRINRDIYVLTAGVWQLCRDSDDWGRALHSWALWHGRSVGLLIILIIIILTIIIIIIKVWHLWHGRSGGLRQTSPTFISPGDARPLWNWWKVYSFGDWCFLCFDHYLCFSSPVIISLMVLDLSTELDFCADLGCWDAWWSFDMIEK